MARYGILIDYEYCSGCRACEVAGKAEKDIPVGKWCIRVLESLPWEIEKDVYEYTFIPYPTDMCDLCEDRVRKGKDPACVHTCLAAVMKFGLADDLAKAMNDKGQQVLFVPRYNLEV
jgi:Fe-S-cluster-containing dehydrogenase component